MSVRNWFDSLTSRLSRPPTRRSRRVSDRRLAARRLLLEGLEDRRLMAFDILAEYATGPNPQHVLLAPMDAGGQPDLVVANGTGAVSIRPGNADGTFGSPVAAATGAGSHSAAAGDLTGDGIPDLVTANSNDLSLLVGNGDGSFQPPVAIGLPGQFSPRYGATLPQSPRSVAVGDLNADGKLDLVVGGQTSFSVYHGYYSCGYYSCGYTGFWSTYTDGYVNVLIGNGSGGFSAPDVDQLGAERSPGVIAIGDVNGDGKADVVTATSSSLSALLGNGTGAVGSPVHSASSSALSSLSLGDLDGDGKLDTVSRGWNSVIVQKGQGDGSFVPSTTANLGYPIDSAVVGDVNADGKLDLVATGTLFTCTDSYWYCYDGNYAKLATVLLGTGQGNFAEPVSSSLGTVDYPPESYYSTLFSDLALADLTGDGLPELVALDSGTGTALVAKGNWPPADAPFISVDRPTVVERDAGTFEVSVTVNLSAAYTQTVTANFHSADGTGLAGSDYVAQSGSLTFTPGETSKTITMLVYGDRLSEADESFSVKLTSVVNATVGNQGVVMILDNEPRISINHQYGIDPLTVVEGDTGTTLAVFTVSLAMPYDQEVTVDYSTLTGHTSDIVEAAGTLRFAPGESSKMITVQVVGDLLDEPLEAFNVILANPSPNASIANSGGYCYIEDNDPSSIAISDASISEGNSGTKLLTFTVSLSNASGQSVSVNYATANGSATTSNNDYLASSGTLYFAPGETSKTVTVSIKGDTQKESDEKFYVNLSGATGGNIADSQGVGTIANDDGPGKGNGKGNKKSLSASAVDAALVDLIFSPKTKNGR